MAEKKGAGGKPQEFDTHTGRYGGKLSEREKTVSAIRKYSDYPMRDITEYGELGAKSRKIIKLSEKEYAEICSAIRTRYADKVPKIGHLLYGNNYYRFRYNRKTERIVCTFKMPINGNEKLIKEWLKL